MTIPVLGERKALAPLSPIAGAEPNGLHAFFNAHLAAGGRHLTANFDRCIETAGPLPRDARLTHLHGAYDPGDLSSLGVEVRRLSRGLPDEARDAIRETLACDGALVVCGYSGRDYFDIDPFLRALADDGFSSPARVVWIDHREADGFAIEDQPARISPMIPLLERLGATVVAAVGRTDRLLAAMGDAWRQPFVESREPCSSREAWPGLDRHDMRSAAAVVFDYIGLGSDLVRLDRRMRLDPRQAARRWRRDAAHHRYAGTGLALHRLALGWFSTREDASLDDLRGSAQVEWLFSLLRSEPVIGRGGLRYLDARAPHRAGALWTRLASDEGYLADHPHAIAQLDRLREELFLLDGVPVPPHIAHRLPSRQAAYFEADSVVGYTNDERNALRRETSPDPERLRRLIARSGVVDDRPGALKAALLARHHGQTVGFPLSRAWLLVGYAYPLKLRFVSRWVRRLPWPAN